MSTLSISEAFSDLADPRVERTRLHSLHDIVVIALCAVVCGAEGWDDFVEFAHAKQEWLSARLRLENGIPCADTFRRVFARLDPEAFTAGFLRWTHSVALENQSGGLRVVAVDGKTLRHSFDTVSEQKAVHMVSAWASETRLVLAQTAVSEKSNEITAVPVLLSLLDLAGCIVTADAMSCQKTIAAQIKKQEGEYVLALKGNHEHLAEDVALLFAHAEAKRWEECPHSLHTEVEAAHGRIETRTCRVISLADLAGTWDDLAAEWGGLACLVEIDSKRQVGAKTSEEKRYSLSSLTKSAKAHLKIIRKHWGIENSVHWVLDVVMNEDACRIRKDNAPHNLATLRHLALNLVRQETTHKTRSESQNQASGVGQRLFGKANLNLDALALKSRRDKTN